MLKFELLNIFLFQHPKDGLGEELVGFLKIFLEILETINPFN